MTDRSWHRQAMIAGDRAGTLDPDEIADLPLLAELLADSCLWAEPAAGLQDAIVEAVASAEPAMLATPRRPPMAASRRWRIVLSSAAVVAAVSALGVAGRRSGAAGPPCPGGRGEDRGAAREVAR